MRWKLVVGGLLAISGLSCTTAWISAYKQEQERKEAIRPEAANSDVAPISAVTVIRTEVWVSEHFAPSSEARQRRARRRVDEANIWMGALGARFEIVSTRTWSVPADTTLKDALTLLENAAPGTDSDFVLGFVPGLNAFTNSFHELGMAREPGKHAVVRAFDDSHELEALRQALQMTTRSEEERIFEERKRHKSAVVVLHEWAHGMGATHDPRATDGFMQVAYDVDMARFSPANQEIIDLGLRLRLGAAASEPAWVRAVVGALRTRPELNPDQKALLAHLESMGLASPSDEAVTSSPSQSSEPAPLPTNPPGNPWAGVRNADLQKVDAAFKTAQSDPAAGWVALATVRESYRDHPAMQVASCTLARQANVLGALDICKVARLVAKDDPRPVLELLADASKAGLSAEGFSLVDEACGRRFHEADHVSARVAHWAISYGAFSCAQIALRRIADPSTRAPLQERLQYQRNEYGVPQSANLSAADELGMRMAVTQVDQLLQQKNLAQAETSAKEAAGKWPLPGTWSVVCEVYGHRGRYQTARTWCQRSIDAFPTDARAHFLMGVLDLRANKSRSAEAHLDRAVIANPYQDRAWELLAQVVGSEEKTKLRERYRKIREKPPTF